MLRRLSWKRQARPPLWHANCFRECRQARRKLNRDPAAITSLSVACRYASRPPSVPTISPLSGTWLPSRVLLLLGAFLPPLHFPVFPPLSPCKPAATPCQPAAPGLSLCGHKAP